MVRIYCLVLLLHFSVHGMDFGNAIGRMHEQKELLRRVSDVVLQEGIARHIQSRNVPEKALCENEVTLFLYGSVLAAIGCVDRNIKSTMCDIQARKVSISLSQSRIEELYQYACTCAQSCNLCMQGAIVCCTQQQSWLELQKDVFKNLYEQISFEQVSFLHGVLLGSLYAKCFELKKQYACELDKALEQSMK